MALRRSPVSLALYVFIALGAALCLLWWAKGGPLAKHESGAGAVAQSSGPNGSAATDQTVATLQQHLRDRPSDADGYAQLGDAYLQKARETADPSYYGKAEQVLTTALQLQPKSFTAMAGMGSLDLSRHQFREALDWAEKGLQLDPYSASLYGIAGDAHNELGEYDQAVDAFQKQQNLRPTSSSYTRVSYARELHGDLDGALDAMRHAADEGFSNAENTAWTLVQVGNLYFNRNDYSNADFYYRKALFNYGNYPHALAGQAKIAAARGKYADAIKLYQQVTQIVPLPEYVIALGDVQAAAGQQAAAARTYDLVGVEEQLFVANGVDSDLEIALFDVDHGLHLDTVLQQARDAEQRRPSTKGDDVLAWVLYKTGDVSGAQASMQRALRLGQKDSLMWYHAALISQAAGDPATARHYLEQALALNPNFSVLYAHDAAQRLAQLRKQGS